MISSLWHILLKSSTVVESPQASAVLRAMSISSQHCNCSLGLWDLLPRVRLTGTYIDIRIDITLVQALRHRC